MIKLRTSIILGLVACCLTASTVAAVPRVMLVEGFTNVGCPYCPVANAATHEFLADYGPSMAIGVSYHVWWPDSSDPLYTLANADSSVYFRGLYYGINSVPSLFADGTSTVTGSVAALEGAATTRLTTDSPFTVAVEQVIAGGMVTVTATVTAVDAVPLSDLALRIALTETEIHYAVAPGSNGQTDFYDTMRDMLPDARGTKFTIGLGETRVFVQSTPVNVAWNLANIRAVVWVQDEVTKEVLQAGSTAPKPNYAFFYGARKSIDVVDLGTLCSYESILTNYGSLSDAYDIHITPDLPTGWSGSICIGTTCYPPWITSIVTSAAPGGPEGDPGGHPAVVDGRQRHHDAHRHQSRRSHEDVDPRVQADLRRRADPVRGQRRRLQLRDLLSRGARRVRSSLRHLGPSAQRRAQRRPARSFPHRDLERRACLSARHGHGQDRARRVP